jgi:CRISPR-associated protein Cmr3
MWLFLEPLDVWLFRDGRPFDARSEHRARSLFPPYPTAIQGAIRSHYLTVKGVPPQAGAKIEDLVGTSADVKNLRLRGPFLARREDGRLVRYFPRPNDAVGVADHPCAIRPASAPKPAEDGGVLTSCPMSHLLGLGDEPAKAGESLWLREDDLRGYLRGDGVDGVPASKLFLRESRLGIGRNDVKRTSEEGLLYEVEFIRPQPDVGLLVQVEGYSDWPEKGLLRIGGEGRAARFEQVTVEEWPETRSPLPARFKLYFATPAYFDGGWQPAGGGWGRFFTGDVRLVAAAVGRYESIGGYDLARDAHKPSRRYVPAGSIYYFDSDGQTLVKPGLVQHAITDCPTGNDYEAAIGFGQVLIEGW